MTPDDYRLLLAKAMSEADLQAEVLKLAKAYGWLAYHPYDSRRSISGWPDLAMVHEGTGRLVLAELKSHRGQPSLTQRAWLKALGEVETMTGGRVQVHLWKPTQLLDGTVVKVLQPRGWTEE